MISNIHPWHLTLSLPPSFSGSWLTIKGEMKHRNSPDSPLFMFLDCEVTFDFIQFYKNKMLTRKGNETNTLHFSCQTLIYTIICIEASIVS